MSLLVNVHSRESLVWLKAPVFYYTINIGPSLGLVYSVGALYYGDPASLGLQGQPLNVLQQILDGVDVEVSHHIVLLLGLAICRVCQPISSPLVSSHPW